MMQRELQTPLGSLLIASTDEGLIAILWENERRRFQLPAIQASAKAAGLLDQAAEELSEYFAGHRQRFEVALAPGGTPFQQVVWKALRSIPYGETRTYAQQAAIVGDAKKARAVGAANGRNPLSIVVPCHRVVGSSGALTGFAGGLEAKSWLLNHERRTLTSRNQGPIENQPFAMREVSRPQP
jgi:methylated-DNA-[protein]-cysteine S-methyltransferase